MEFVIKENPSEVADYAAGIVSSVIAAKPDAAIAVPTGKTPLPLFERLSGMAQRREPALDLVRWFALDEFIGPAVPRESTFAFLLEERLLNPAGIPHKQLHTLEGSAPEPDREAQRYEQLIAARGGLDLAILGLGRNGHIGFNEPGTPFSSRTGVRRLTESTCRANAYLFPASTVPDEALTMGIATLMEARKVLVLATGPVKAGIVRQLATLKPDTTVPATALKAHDDCVIVVDTAAGALL